MLIRRLLRSVKSFVRDNKGQDLFEYVMLVSLLALLLVGAVTAAGGGGGGNDGDDGDDN